MFVTSRFKFVEITLISTIAVASRCNLIEITSGISVSFNFWHKIIARASIKVAIATSHHDFVCWTIRSSRSFYPLKRSGRVSCQFKWYSTTYTTRTTDFPTDFRLYTTQCVRADFFFSCMSANITYSKNFCKIIGKPWILLLHPLRVAANYNS